MKIFISALAFLVTTYAFGAEVETPCPAMQQEAREKIINKNAKEKSVSDSNVIRK